FWDNKEKKDTKLDDDTTRQANTTGDGCQFAPASTGCLTTSTTADLQRQFTPPLDEASSFHNQSISTTPLSYAYVERHQAPIACDQIVGVSSNVRRRLTTSQSIMLVNVSRLPRTSKQHLWPSDILRNHDMPSDYATQAYMVQDVVTQQLSTPRDTSGGIICWESWRCKTPNPITRDLKPLDKKKKSKMKKLNWKQQLL
ncbi:hypothetical protein Tco_0834566, partial [Tanacetum coccineum]